MSAVVGVPLVVVSAVVSWLVWAIITTPPPADVDVDRDDHYDGPQQY